MLSAPGESRECVEIARRIHAAARAGMPFDRIAVLLRAPDAYRPFLVEALRRAGIPAHFARGARRPDPSGRALLALLACAAEGSSARRFAEYLSLGEVPLRAPGGDPPAAPAAGRALRAARRGAAERARESRTRSPSAESEGDGEPDPALGSGSLPAPRRWERLLVEAAVIGGRERWKRRLDGYARELEQKIAALDDPEGATAQRLRRDREDLAALRAFALPLVDELAALPAAARWGEWIDALGALATRALRSPERVLSVLAELAPMAAGRPVGLREVQLVLAPRLQQVASPPPGARYGKVFVAPIEAARGLEFDVVFVPGLAEKLFPRKIGEEPILLDAVRERLGAGLATNERRLDAERLALRLAVGAARERVVLSFPRLDVDGSRPRVPSFYALEALRAAEGVLPGFDELVAARRDARRGAPRLARARAARRRDRRGRVRSRAARDARSATTAASRGAARYLLGANPAPRARAALPRAALERRGLDARGRAREADRRGPRARSRRTRSPRAATRRPRSSTTRRARTVLPPGGAGSSRRARSPRRSRSSTRSSAARSCTRCSSQLFGALRDAGLLPVTPARLDAARAHLDVVLEKVAARLRGRARARDRARLARRRRVGARRPARVAAARERGRLRLRAVALRALVRPAERSRRGPGLAGRRRWRSTRGCCLRGSIDLVERARRRPAARHRPQDRQGALRRRATSIDGGRTLQPVLYALAVEKLFPELAGRRGRLYYCTAAGGFAEREVAARRRRARARREPWPRRSAPRSTTPFLPAAPDRRTRAAGATTARLRPVRGAARRAQVPARPRGRCTQLRELP